MTFCLDTIILKPENGLEIKNAIILLHGYGGDGQDISTLSLSWRRHLPNTIFICPNGHERCTLNPSGYQWFDLSKDDPEYILNESSIYLKKYLSTMRSSSKTIADSKVFKLSVTPLIIFNLLPIFFLLSSI